MRLIDVVAKLESLDSEATIYAAKPWTSESPVIVEAEPPAGGLPDAASQRGLSYFLEVFVARDFLAGWQSTLDAVPNDRERCDRVILYAINDV